MNGMDGDQRERSRSPAGGTRNDSSEQLGVPGIVKCGHWYTPGMKVEIMELRSDKRVVYYNSTLQPTKPHGTWHEFRYSHGTTFLSITFTWFGNFEARRLRQHLLRQLMPGLYRTTDHQQVYYVPADFENTAPIHREGLVPFDLDEDKASNVKHFFLWLHPGKDMDFVALLKDRTVRYAKGTSTDLSDGGPQNGMYEYEARMDDNQNCWFITFHAAENQLAPTTLLSRASDDGNIWRASGDHRGNFDDDTYSDLKAWHIIAVRKWG